MTTPEPAPDEIDSPSRSIEEWASAYIAFQLDASKPTDGHPDWWAVKKFMDEADTEDCWNAILVVLSKEPPDAVLGVLAAGPLEDLIHFAGSQFIDRIETEARRNPAFRDLLGGVWKSGTPDVWARVESARGEPW